MLRKLKLIPLLCSVIIVSTIYADSDKGFSIDQDCSSKVCFPKLAQLGTKSVPLASSLLYRYYLWKPYSIALYAEPEDANKSKILEDVHKKLVLHYHMDFSAQEIIEAADKLLESNPNVNMQSISESLAKINALYKDIKEGDAYSLEYVPSEGTKLILNQTLLGVVPGAEFGKAYFGIWLSDYAISKNMTDQLLASLDT